MNKSKFGWSNLIEVRAQNTQKVDGSSSGLCSAFGVIFPHIP